MNFKSVDDVLDFAIAREEEAASFYKDLATKMSNPHTKQLFELFSKEEMGHKLKLLNIKDDKSLIPVEKEIRSLSLADYLVDIEVTPQMNYQEALIVAMKKEKAAFKLYNDLASATNEPSVRAIFQILSQEEAKHKLRFEIEYDGHILTEN
jgi:rubrerythrin